MRRWVIVCLGLGVYGCNDAVPQCKGAPLETQYTCPSPPTDAGCVGGPTCFAPQADPKIDFPVGCEATLPQCGLYHEPITCTCTPNGSGSSAPIWICHDGVEPAGC